MNIHVFVDVYPHPFKSYFDVQFEEWQKAGHSVEIFSLSEIAGSVSPVPVRVIKTFRTGPLHVGFGIVVAAVKSPRRALKVLRSEGSIFQRMKVLATDSQVAGSVPDLIFVHNLAAGSRFAYLKRIFPRVPFSLYYHGGEIPGVPPVHPEKARRAFAAPDVVFSNTRYSIEDAVRRGAPAEKMKKVPVGFRLDDYAPRGERKYLRDGRMYFMSVGRFSPEKGFDIALKAVAELRRQGCSHLHYTLIGDGPQMQALRSLAEGLGISALVSFAGQLRNRDVISRLAQADVLILPSIPGNTWEENQGCVMQEAMLMGAAVVASDTGGVGESIPEPMREYLFSPHDHLNLAKNLTRLLEAGSDQLRTLGAAGRQFVEENYDIRRINEALIRESFVAAGDAERRFSVADPVRA